jgi:aryl-alcohol dehydrogenase-like predicted oxidoreductase
MRYGRIAGIDLPISRLVQGTATVTSNDLDGAFALLDDAFEMGCTVFDTAHVYGKGDSERTVGRWVNSRGIRDKVVIIGKGAHHNEDRKRVTPFDISSDLFDSLARFGFEYIDLYLLHRDDPSVPVEPLVDALNEHVQAGRITAFGASNWTHERIQKANTYANDNGLLPMVASSPSFSLAEQVREPWPDCVNISGEQGETARTWYKSTRMPLFTWSSLAGGFFSGRFTRENLNTFEERLDRLCVEAYCYEQNFERLDRARLLGKQKNLSVPQVALAYVMNQPLNIFALIGSRNGEEFRVSLDASEVVLSTSDLRWLENGLE